MAQLLAGRLADPAIQVILSTLLLKASFGGLFKTNFCGHFLKLFLFTKFNFSKFREKVFLTVLRFMCLEFCASNYLPKLPRMAYFKILFYHFPCHSCCQAKENQKLVDPFS